MPLLSQTVHSCMPGGGGCCGACSAGAGMCTPAPATSELVGPVGPASASVVPGVSDQAMFWLLLGLAVLFFLGGSDRRD